jgi:GntR family histidine utilization transcriptional repressor
MDSIPIAYEERFAIPDVYPDFLDQDFTKISVFSYFASRSSLQEIENVVRAILPEKRIAQLLEVEETEPCLQLQRRNWFESRVVTLSRFTYAGSRQVLASRYRP